MEIIQLTFEDWKDTTAENNRYFSAFGRYNFEPKEALIERRFDNILGYYVKCEPFKVVISDTEIEKIQERQKEIYEEYMDLQLKKTINNFENEVSQKASGVVEVIIKGKHQEHIDYYYKEFRRKVYDRIVIKDYYEISHKCDDGRNLITLGQALITNQNYLFELRQKFDKYLDERGQENTTTPKTGADEEKKDSSDLEVTENQRNQAKHYVMNFESIYKTRKNTKLALIDFESKEIKGFTKKTLERSIKIHYNDKNLTFKSYVERYLTDKLSDKK